jgi:hypothetical protein
VDPSETDTEYALYLRYQELAWPDGPGRFVPRAAPKELVADGWPSHVPALFQAYRWAQRARDYDRKMEAAKAKGFTRAATAWAARHSELLDDLEQIGSIEIKAMLKRSIENPGQMPPRLALAIVQLVAKERRLLAGEPTEIQGRVPVEEIDPADLPMLRAMALKYGKVT